MHSTLQDTNKFSNPPKCNYVSQPPAEAARLQGLLQGLTDEVTLELH